MGKHINVIWREAIQSYLGRMMAKKRLSLTDKLFRTLIEAAPKFQEFMRRSAVWKDDHDKLRSYLRCVPFVSKNGQKMGLYAYYDLNAYKKHRPAEEIEKFNFGYVHETYHFPNLGYISIILPNRPNTVLNEQARSFFDAVRRIVRETIKKPFAQTGYKSMARVRKVDTKVID